MSMTIDDLVTLLQRVKKAKGGSTLVKASSFCGTNGDHVCFDLNRLPRDFQVADHLNDAGDFVLGCEISTETRDKIKTSIKDMERLGYRFYRSQFCGTNKAPQTGLSPCEWHTPW